MLAAGVLVAHHLDELQLAVSPTVMLQRIKNKNTHTFVIKGKEFALSRVGRRNLLNDTIV